MQGVRHIARSLQRPEKLTKARFKKYNLRSVQEVKFYSEHNGKLLKHQNRQRHNLTHSMKILLWLPHREYTGEGNGRQPFAS